jgi:hypothetical protein
MSSLHIYDVIFYAFICFRENGKKVGERFTMVLDKREYDVRVDCVFKKPVKNEKIVNANVVICHNDIVFDHTVSEGLPCLHITRFGLHLYSVNYKGGSFSFPLDSILNLIDFLNP